MIILNLAKSFTSDYIIDRDRRVKFNWARVWAFIFALSTIFVLPQTALFVSSWSRPGGVEGIKRDMASDSKTQGQRRAEYLHQGTESAPEGIVPLGPFTSEERLMLDNATNFLKDDESLQKDLLSKFGVTFRDLNAVIIPEWEMKSVNAEMLGITRAGMEDAYAQEPWGFDVGGITVRDRGGLAPATSDGRPRIALNLWSFNSTKELRSALFHEMLHAINVPGYRPLCVSRSHGAPVCAVLAQSDLVYLPEYRNFRDRAKLKGVHDAMINLLFLALLLLLIGCVKDVILHSSRRDIVLGYWSRVRDGF